MEQRQRFALMIVVVVVILGTGAWLIEDDMRNDQARKDRLVAPWRADRASFATLLKDGTDGQITFGQLDKEFSENVKERTVRQETVGAQQFEADADAKAALLQVLADENSLVRDLQVFSRIERDELNEPDGEHTLESYDQSGYFARLRANREQDLSSRRADSTKRVLASLEKAETAEAVLGAIFSRSGIPFDPSIRSSDNLIRSWVAKH